MTAADALALVRGAASAERVVLASDFDGTLAPFVTDPMQARPAPGAMDALRRAAALPGVTVALVSGRDVATLAALSGVEPGEPIVLIGSHGGQSTRPQVVTGGGLDAAAAELVGVLAAELGEVAAAHPGARLESKDGAMALHTRGLPEPLAEQALAAARAVGAAHPGAHVMPGKSVVELRVVDASKGAALARLVDLDGAQACVYFGDDVTDERAFEALDPARGDVTVKVGEGATAACTRLPEVSSVVTALSAFVDARLAAHPG